MNGYSSYRPCHQQRANLAWRTQSHSSQVSLYSHLPIPLAMQKDFPPWHGHCYSGFCARLPSAASQHMRDIRCMPACLYLRMSQCWWLLPARTPPCFHGRGPGRGDDPPNLDLPPGPSRGEGKQGRGGNLESGCLHPRDDLGCHAAARRAILLQPRVDTRETALTSRTHKYCRT